MHMNSDTFLARRGQFTARRDATGHFYVEDEGSLERFPARSRAHAVDVMLALYLNDLAETAKAGLRALREGR